MSHSEDRSQQKEPAGDETLRITDSSKILRAQSEHTIRVLVSRPPSEPAAFPPADSEKSRCGPLNVQGGHKYDIERLVARGGMGAIYKTRDVQCERVVALKMLPTTTAGELPPNSQALFVSEAQITSQLEHPNIVPIHELGTDEEGNTFYTMKYIRGVSLSEILSSLRRGDNPAVIEQYPLGRLLTIFQKACDAVAFAHSKGIIHRDLKPGNIMIGDYGEVLVLDWGLARRLDRESDRIQEPSGEIIGTPIFMSPEQARGRDGELDERSDIYSLGAVLYNILALQPPVQGETVREILNQIIQGQIVAPIALRQTMETSSETGTIAKSIHFPHCPDGQIPPILSDLVMKAMALNPSDRYPSVRSLQKAIEAYQNGFVWHLVLDDDFSDMNVASRWNILEGECEVKPGELRLRGGQPQILLLRRDLAGDVRIEFECRQEGAYLNEIGCILGAIPAATAWDTLVSGYQLKFGAHDNSLNIVSRGEKILSEHTASPLASGQTYRVCVERIGPRLKFTVNDQEVFNLVDPDPLTGADRTGVGLIGWLSDTRYTRIKVFSLGTPWKADVIDIAERHLQKGNYGTAMDLFQEILLSFPDTPRMERARRGFQTAEYRHVLASTLPSWREQLRKAWRDVDFKLRIDNDGLSLDVPGGSIDNLAPLQGIPLNALRISWNRVSDLEPLRHMPLKLLHCEENPVSSLEPLRAMTLDNLKCDNCSITSLAPLRGMPLTSLSCSGNPLQDGLEPLKGMSLIWLSCVQSNIESLEPLRGMPLTSLFADANRIADLAPLAGMPLSALTCSGNHIEHLDPLNGMPLNALHCGTNRIKSLEPLRGMPLNALSCQNNLIESIEPLKNMALSSLMCGANRLRSIAPLVKTPPKCFMFDCESLPTGEIQWALDIWARDFRLSTYANSVKVLLAVRKVDIDQLRSLSFAHNGHRYLVIPTFAQWAEAKALCERFGGHLATITDKETNDFLSTFFPFGGSWFWIGLEVTGAGPRWITGEPFGYSAFLNDRHATEKGPKIYSCKHWMHDVVPGACNGFMIEWDS